MKRKSLQHLGQETLDSNQLVDDQLATPNYTAEENGALFSTSTQ